MIFLPRDPEILVKGSTEYRNTDGSLTSYSVYPLLFLRLFTGLCTFLVVGISLIIFFKLRLIGNLPASLVSINPATALLFALSGISLLVLQNVQTRNLFLYLISVVFSLTTVFLSSISLSGWKISLDLSASSASVILKDLFDSVGIYAVVPTISLSFWLFGFSLLIFWVPRLKKVSQLINIIIFTFYGGILLGQLFGVSNPYNLAPSFNVVVWVPLAFTFLSASGLLSRPEVGLTTILVRESLGGVVVRRFASLFTSFILLSGYLVLIGERAGLYNSSYGLFLLVVVILVALTISVWIVSLYLEKLEKEKAKRKNIVEPKGEFTAYSLAAEKSRFEQETRNRDIQGSQDRLKTVFASSPNLVFIKNKEGFFEFVNKRFETVFHVGSDTLLGKTGVGYLPHEIANGWAQNDRAVLDLGQTVSLEQKVRQDDGLNHTYFVTKFPLLDDSGRPKAICGIGTDVTDIKEYQNFLIQEKIKEEAILNSVGDGIVATDSRGKLLIMNKACSTMTGFFAQDLTNVPWAQVVKMEDESGKSVGDCLRPITQALAQKEKITSSDSYYVRKDGTRFPVSIIATPIIFEDQIAGVVEAFRDVTKEKQLENAKDEFVSMVSHELKAPMTAIRGGLAVVLKGDYGALSEELKPVLSRMFEYMGKLLNLTEDILKISKIESGVLEVTPVRVNLGQVVTEVCTNLKVLADKKKIQLNKGELTSREVSGDPVLITEIVTNLINNGIKFTETGGVTVYSREDGNLLGLYVQDTGVGIPEDEQAKLFGKFQQISGSSGRPEGTGLGLYLSKEMTKLIGGNLKLFDSVEGKGSTFVLSLPFAS